MLYILTEIATDNTKSVKIRQCTLVWTSVWKNSRQFKEIKMFIFQGRTLSPLAPLVGGAKWTFWNWLESTDMKVQMYPH